ncbi:MAG: hypothetical protein WDN10_01380 [bacterium]
MPQVKSYAGRNIRLTPEQLRKLEEVYAHGKGGLGDSLSTAEIAALYESTRLSPSHHEWRICIQTKVVEFDGRDYMEFAMIAREYSEEKSLWLLIYQFSGAPEDRGFIDIESEVLAAV